jgi:hypothetical protein
VKLRSSINSDLLRFALIRGSIFAICGVVILLFAGVFLPAKELGVSGPFLVVTALLFITLGLYPYQQLKKLQTTPHEILLIDEENILFSWKRKSALMIPLKSIAKIEQVNKAYEYGIGIYLKNHDLSELEVNQATFNLKKFYVNSNKKYGCDLFLPFFSKNSFVELKKFIHK